MATKVEEKNAPAQEAATEEVKQKEIPRLEVKFNQPDRKKHSYISVDPEGYTVDINQDRKSWTVKAPDGRVLTKAAGSRQEAYNIVTAEIYPEQAARDAEIEKQERVRKAQRMLNGKEYKLLTALIGLGTVKDIDALIEPTGFQKMEVMGICANLHRKKLIAMDESGLFATVTGKNAAEVYVEPVKKERGTKERKVRDPLARQKKLEEKYGPKPEGIADPPTDVEFQECRLRNAEASLDYAIMVQRIHPYSPIAAKKVKSAQERVNAAREAVEKAKAKAASVTEAAPATETAVSEEE